MQTLLNTLYVMTPNAYQNVIVSRAHVFWAI